MSEIIHQQDTRYLEWAARRIGITTFRNDAKTIAIRRYGEISGVVVYDTFSAVDCNMSAASDGTGYWMSRSFLRAIFMYPFAQLGLRRVTAIVASRNTQSLNYCQNMGFKVEGFCPHAMADDDAFILGMLRENCRFIPATVRTQTFPGARVPQNEDSLCTKQLFPHY